MFNVLPKIGRFLESSGIIDAMPGICVLVAACVIAAVVYICRPKKAKPPMAILVDQNSKLPVAIPMNQTKRA